MFLYPLKERTHNTPEHYERRDSLKTSFSRAYSSDVDEIAQTVSQAFFKKEVYRKPGANRVTQQMVEEDIEIAEDRDWYIVRNADPKEKNRIISAVLLVDEGDNEASINMFSTHPDFMGQKLGKRKLLNKVEEKAASMGKEILSLWCVDQLSGYYKGCGFEKTGDSRGYDNAYLKEEYHDQVKIVKMIKPLKV